MEGMIGKVTSGASQHALADISANKRPPKLGDHLMEQSVHATVAGHW
jgi:hypothetical protein